ncbi:putative F-box domain, galactose oxidase/kelch, beta-propeller, F-box associated interaction [Helianthus debilis subsp. tardiflorus]
MGCLHPVRKKLHMRRHAQSRTCIDDIGIDILVSHILVRLPARCVGQCRCVCREWLSLLSTQQFAITHCRHISTTYDQKFILIGSLSGYVYPVALDHLSRSSKIVVSLPFERSSCHVRILASFKGLLCICLCDTGEMLIWNPLTQVYKMVANSKIRGLCTPQLDAVGFYVDSSKGYMLLHLKRFGGKMWLYIYSLRRQLWRKVGFLDKQKYFKRKLKWSNGTFYKGVVYFTVDFIKNHFHSGSMLLGFDVKLEKFNKIRYPNVPRDDLEGHLFLIHNNLHIFLTHGMPFWSVDLWRLDGYVTPRILLMSKSKSDTDCYWN